MLEAFLIFEHFIGAISDLSRTSGTSCEHATITYTDPQRATILALLEGRYSLLFGGYQCLLPGLQGHIICGLLIGGWVWGEQSLELISFCVLLKGITKNSPHFQACFLPDGTTHPFSLTFAEANTIRERKKVPLLQPLTRRNGAFWPS